MNAEVPLNEWLLHVASKGAVILGVALLAGLLLHRMAAARRYALWLVALGAVTLLPFAVALLPAWRVLPPPAEPLRAQVEAPEPMNLPQALPMLVRASLERSAALATNTPSTTAAPALAPQETVVPQATPQLPSWSWDQVWQALPLAWFAVSVFLVLRLLWAGAKLRRLEKTLPVGECVLLPFVATELGLKRPPLLLVGAANAVPMVWGCRRPRLLLPQGFDTWEMEKLRGVLLHELAHLQRRDPLALWLAQGVKMLHWFNPLAWLAFRQLRADQERACDDTALRHGVRPSEYAQHLLDLSRHTRIAPGLALCALTITRCAPVEARVRAVLDARRPRQALSHRWLLALSALALATSLPVAMLHAIESASLRGRLLDRNGVVLAESTAETVRRYPLKALTGHITGYTRGTAGQPLPRSGASAQEKAHETALSGGADVTLSLDARVQSIALRAMQEAGFERGAAVVLDPRTGEILAAVSLPVYDPNRFTPVLSKEHWEELVHRADTPLIDRAVTARQAPGAAFMPVTALAASAAGVADIKHSCNGSVTYGSKAFVCWRSPQSGTGHGLLGITDALAHSCSCYWYQAGNAAGADAITSAGERIGFGEVYGVSPEESAGNLPSPGGLKDHQPKERWTNGHTANLAIGQGTLITSPLQLAVLAATVARHGSVPQPTFLKLTRAGDAQVRADLVAEGVRPEHVEQIREGMREVVNAGASTGLRARSPRVVIAGKTGTAQGWRRVGEKRVEDNSAWFIGFAPYDQPTLAFAILKQGGKSGGSDCAPVARSLVEAVLALPLDGSGAVLPVEEAAPPAARPSSPSSRPRVEVLPSDDNRWKGLQRQGNLAPLPSGSVTEHMSQPNEPSFNGWFYFRFSAPRAAVLDWLVASLPPELQRQQAEALRWPEPPAAFTCRYVAANACEILVIGDETDRAYVSITKAKPSLRIAPDEATPPMPKTAAPRELNGVVEAPESNLPPPWARPKPATMMILDPYRAETEDLMALVAQQRARADKTLLVNPPQGM